MVRVPKRSESSDDPSRVSADLLRRVLDKLGPLNDPILVFLILFVVVVALFRDRILGPFQWLAYIAVIVGPGSYLLRQYLAHRREMKKTLSPPGISSGEQPSGARVQRADPADRKSVV